MNHIKKSLAVINFFLADVRDGIGPFLAVYLIAELNWTSDKIGMIMTIGGIATLLLQIPAGAIVDQTKYKRFILIFSSTVIAFSMLLIQFYPSYSLILMSKFIVGASAAFIAPVIAALTLGTVGAVYYAKQVANNESYNHLGNIFACIMAAIIAKTIGLGFLFSFSAVMALFVIIATLSVKPKSIDHYAARGLDKSVTNYQPSSTVILFKNKILLVFGLSILMFHLSNAAMLLLLGEEVALKYSGADSIMFLSGSIISAQAIMFLMTLLAKSRIDKWGRKPLFLIAFIVLPIRGILFILSSNPYYLLLIQLLDGVAAGLFGVLFPVVVADFTKGSGHYNIALGALSAMQGIGATLSIFLSGFIVKHFGFQIAFLMLSGFALIALIIYAIFVPESKDHSTLADEHA